MDSIIARGLTFQACHGVAAQEKIQPQTFIVDVEISLDLQAAGLSDDLQLSVNYDRVYHLVKKIAEEKSYALIEALAEDIAGQLLSAFILIQAVEVTVYKPQAPVEGDFKYFAVKIKRFQK